MAKSRTKPQMPEHVFLLLWLRGTGDTPDVTEHRCTPNVLMSFFHARYHDAIQAWTDQSVLGDYLTTDTGWLVVRCGMAFELVETVAYRPANQT